MTQIFFSWFEYNVKIKKLSISSYENQQIKVYLNLPYIKEVVKIALFIIETSTVYYNNRFGLCK